MPQPVVNISAISGVYVIFIDGKSCIHDRSEKGLTTNMACSRNHALVGRVLLLYYHQLCYYNTKVLKSYGKRNHQILETPYFSGQYDIEDGLNNSHTLTRIADLLRKDK